MASKLWNPRFMFMGNSIVTGLDGTGNPVATLNAYRKTVWDYFVAQGLTRARGLAFVGSQHNGIVTSGNWDDANEGHPGYTTQMILNELVGWLRQAQPGAIITQFGINDIGDAIDATADARFRVILDTIRAFDPTIMTFVSSMTVLEGASVDTETHRTNLNAQFQATCIARAATGHRVVYIDAGNMITSADIVPASSGDGIHPNPTGYINYGNAVGSLLLPYIPLFKA